MPYTPENLKFGGGLSESLLHPAVLALLILAIPLILFLRRERLLGILIPMSLLIPLGQQIVVGGVHLLVVRILILTGLVRAVIDVGWAKDSLNKLFVVWAVVRAMAFLMTFPETEAVVNQFGFLWDTLGGFFLFRFLIQTDEDVQRAIRVFAGVALVLASCMLNEHFSRVNAFGYLGGVPLAPAIREGSVRSQGPFAHALLAGTFGATLLPLFVWLWLDGKSRILAVGGVLACLAITVLSASSTPILALGAAILGICLWPLRDYVGYLRWGFVLAFCGLSIVMNAPVWFVLARIDLAGGSSGYHRALLIDQFIKHFGDWWLIGTASNGSWGWDLWDTCNQFVTEGQTGGLITLVCFIAMIVILFRRSSAARRASRGDQAREWYFWLLGVSLFTHCVAFLGIVYFDQTRMLWYAFLAILIVATSPSSAFAVAITPRQEKPTRPSVLWFPVPVEIRPTGETKT